MLLHSYEKKKKNYIMRIPCVNYNVIYTSTSNLVHSKPLDCNTVERWTDGDRRQLLRGSSSTIEVIVQPHELFLNAAAISVLLEMLLSTLLQSGER
jgi:hypothetical protein